MSDDKPPIPTIGLSGAPAPQTVDFLSPRGPWRDYAATAAEQAAERLQKLREGNEFVLCPEVEMLSEEELRESGLWVGP